MAINAIGSASSAVQQQLPVQARQEPPRQPEPASQPTEQPRETNVIESREAQKPPPPPETRQAENSERPEPPKPVVNAQGQKTGTIINTTA
ncbi:MAG: hypothetical protein AB1642_07470 [Pseudomonadota bacterium]